MTTKPPRYRLMVSVLADDLIVIIKAEHKTKDSLREAWAVAKLFVAQGKLQAAEAWDDAKPELLASVPKDSQFVMMPPVKRSTKQPTNDKPKTKRSVKNVVQPNNTGRKPRKGSRA